MQRCSKIYGGPNRGCKSDVDPHMHPRKSVEHTMAGYGTRIGGISGLSPKLSRPPHSKTLFNGSNIIAWMAIAKFLRMSLRAIVRTLRECEYWCNWILNGTVWWLITPSQFPSSKAWLWDTRTRRDQRQSSPTGAFWDLVKYPCTRERVIE